MNNKLTPLECVDHVFRRVDRLATDAGICEKCALKLMSYEYGIDYGKLLYLYLERNVSDKDQS